MIENYQAITGLVAATHTPFDLQGAVNLAAIEKQAEHLLQAGVVGAFVCGSTGEGHSLTINERKAVAQRWSEVVKGTNLKLIVHVGSNCLKNAAELASHAQSLNVKAIAAMSPSYYRPADIEVLVQCVAEVAEAAAETPFYFYDIPAMTGVKFSMPEFLQQGAERIPNLVGLKFTSDNLVSLQHCLDDGPNPWNILFGTDELLLPALGLGVTGAVGSSFNFMARVYCQVITRFAANDLAAARMWQLRAIRVIELLGKYDYLPAARGLMAMLDVDVGPPRMPFRGFPTGGANRLRGELEVMGFFDWIKP
jgi:N-acetylneuraminate lyase